MKTKVAAGLWQTRVCPKCWNFCRKMAFRGLSNSSNQQAGRNFNDLSDEAATITVFAKTKRELWRFGLPITDR